MSDLDFVDVPSSASSPCTLSPKTSISLQLATQARINDGDRLAAATDQIPTPVHDLDRACESAGNPSGPDKSIDGADVTPTLLPDGSLVQPTLELNSFLPIIQALGSTLHSGALASPNDHYYFRGIPSDSEIRKLESLVHRVDAFSLTKSSHTHIPIAMILRILRIRPWSGPFFPVLKSFRITDVNSDTMSFLDLFYSSSLESFELTDLDSWSSSCINALQNFLHDLPQECPNLSVIKVLLYGSTLDVDVRFLDFVYLRELHLRNAAINNWQILYDISQMASLQVLDLQLAVPKSYNRRFSQEKRSINDWNAIVDSPERGDPIGFRALSTLAIIAVIEILDDLIGMVASNNLQELNMELLAYFDPPPSRPLKKKSTGRKVLINTHFTPINEVDYFFSLLSKILRQCSTVKRVFLGLSHEVGTGRPPRDRFISSIVLEELLRSSGIERLTIGGWKFDFTIITVIEAVGRNTHLRSLTFPADRHAYCNIGQQGFPLSTLSSIAHVFPNLDYFQGYVVRHISDIPDFFLDGSAPLPNNPAHPLRALYLGDGQLFGTGDDKYFSLRVAFYIYRLFPDLQNIITSEGKDGDDWRFIEKAVKMCQACRAS